ncbi:YdcF family protein [Paenibacillus sacheonensis]|uniref:YdcF family protein n=1 Tax=Paenibacillus sacheonensis TaxID=742054 RepID=A0A7X5C0B7_9BACL|nr:YdcF family protein [Paenibacillus sacheonensis]NBC71401.1 YdcF family protein [Paenibacillus sacheonensis]
MIYLIKFAYGFLLLPGIFVVLLGAAGIWLWIKRSKSQAIGAFAFALLLYLCSIGAISDGIMRNLEHGYAPPSDVAGDVIVVLGGGATDDTPDIDGEGNLYGSAGNRLLAAARLYRKTGLPILFSGGKVFADTGNEAEIAKRQLIGLQVPADRILVENRSLNTAQNAEFTGELLKNHHLTKPILVTSAFHMKRSVLDFRKEGIAVVPYPVDYKVSLRASYSLNKWSPSSSAMDSISTCLKEYIGIMAAKLLHNK